MKHWRREKKGLFVSPWQNHLSQTQFIAYGFFAVILIGALLLTLPFASRDGQSIGFLNALFTATSATCVTGLVVADTWTQWTLFGQIVIICLIQIGGLGFITIGVGLSIILRRKIGLRERGLLQESVNTLQIGGVVRLARKIFIGTFLLEGTGAFLLALRFVPQYGLLRGVYYGVFHSISAFCNAGFDLMGFQDPYCSLVNYYDDWLVNLVIMSLIVIGGIGFIVWDDLSRHRLHFRKYMLHTKIVLLTTAVLIFGGALLFYLIERDGVLEGMSVKGSILSSLFASVTARTAGFNTVDVAAMTDGSKFLTILLMFIGGSPGSTAGGVKTTTIIVLLLCVLSNVRRESGLNVFGRRIEDDTIKQASAIMVTKLVLCRGVSLVIMGIQPEFLMSDVLFETFSAIGTVGISTGITRELLPLSKVLIILLMYSGRIGSLSFALAFTQQKRIPPVKLPVGRISIG